MLYVSDDGGGAGAVSHSCVLLTTNYSLRTSYGYCNLSRKRVSPMMEKKFDAMSIW